MSDAVLSTPAIYSLELTPACNNRCIGCSNVFARNRAPLSASGWQQVLAHIAPHAQSLKLTGGEPTLHSQFEAIIQSAAELDIPFTLFTNARWTEPEQLIGLLRSVPQCDGLLVSLHGADAAGHESFTGQPGSFEETTVNIHRAARAGLRVHISTVITHWNWEHVSKVAELGQKLGARYAVFNRYIGPENPQIEPDDDQILAAIVSIENLQCKNMPVKFGNCIPQCFINNSSRGCWAGRAYCTIDPWGNMRPCNHSPKIVGNVIEEPIEDLWHSEVMNRWRALLPEQCETCAELGTCHGGCRALAEIRGIDKDPLTRQPIQEKFSYSPVELALYERDRPTLRCTILQEPFGYALVRGTTIVFITPQAKPILDRLDGCMTLRQIRGEFGQNALDFVGSLCYQGLVGIET